MFSKRNGLDPVGSGDHSHTSFSIGGFWTAQRTLGSYVIYFAAFVAVLANVIKNLEELLNVFIFRSVLGSVIGTCLGILGTTINNRLRMRELRNLVNDAIAVNKSTPIASTASAAAAAAAVALPAPPEGLTT